MTKATTDAKFRDELGTIEQCELLVLAVAHARRSHFTNMKGLSC